MLEHFTPFITFLLRFIPYTLIWLLLTLVYYIMPNKRVNFKHALISGIIAGTIFQLTQWGYITFQVGMSRYNAIYGSFAALPLFLIWLQLSWLVILVGAELAYANQNVDRYEYTMDSFKISYSYRRVLALLVMQVVAKQFENALNALSVKEISQKLELPVYLVENILNELKESSLVSAIQMYNEKKPVFQPALDINKLTISYVINTLEEKGIKDIHIAKTRELKIIMNSFNTFNAVIEKSEANMLLKEL